MSVKALDLFQAYSENNLPQEGGYIVSSFFSTNSKYSIYELVAFAGVKNLYLTEDGLTFQTDGNKLYVLVEPASYHNKYIEPFRRESKEQIPHRFNELEVYTSRDQSKVMVSKTPIISYGSFTILTPSGMDFALIFFNLPDVKDSLDKFFRQTLNKEAGIPKPDAVNSAKIIISSLEKFGLW